MKTQSFSHVIFLSWQRAQFFMFCTLFVFGFCAGGVFGFNRDAYGDLISSARSENIDSIDSAGMTFVQYGTVDGLTGIGSHSWTEEMFSSGAERMDSFGAALAVGDFNGDGYYDAAMGEPFNNDGYPVVMDDTGCVWVVYGSSSGLFPGANYAEFSQFSDGMPGDATEWSSFGWALASGDFNADGNDDLAIGVPGQNTLEGTYVGAVVILYGASWGLSIYSSVMLGQGSLGLTGEAQPSDNFGSTLASGDFNGDGYADLIVGSPNDTKSGITRCGSVNVIYGSGDGLSALRNEFWDQDSPNMNDAAESEDYFGFSLAPGDFDYDGFDDVAIGIPNEDLEGISNCGAISVMYGTSIGLSAGRNLLISQDYYGIGETKETDDFVGYSLACGDFNHDGWDDLVVGVPFEDGPGIIDGGMVHELQGGDHFGTGSGINDQWGQDSSAINDSAENYDYFGYSFATGDLDGDGFDDLAIGVPGESIETTSVSSAGIVQVLYGDSDWGLVTANNQVWMQGVNSMPDQPEVNDFFGSVLAIAPPGVVPTPTATPTTGPGTPTNTPHAPTPTPPGCTERGATIVMPSAMYREGDSCYCNVVVCNPESTTYNNMPLMVVLDVYGQYFFAPSFTSFDQITIDVTPGQQTIQVLPPFSWPAGAGTASGIRFHAAMTNQAITELFGTLDSFSFGWE